MVSFTYPKGKYLEKLNAQLWGKHESSNINFAACRKYVVVQVTHKGVGFLALATVFKTYAGK